MMHEPINKKHAMVSRRRMDCHVRLGLVNVGADLMQTEKPADGWDDAGFNCDGELCGGCGRRMAGGERLYFHRICIDARPVYDLYRCLECCNAEITRLKIEDVLSNETSDRVNVGADLTQTEKPDEAGPVTHSVPWSNPCRVKDAHGNEVRYCIACCQGTGWCEVFVEAGGQLLVADDEIVSCWIRRPGPLVITPKHTITINNAQPEQS